jgi:hypothetical protein
MQILFKTYSKHIAIFMAICLGIYALSFVIFSPKDDGLPAVSGVNESTAMVITGCMATVEAERKKHINKDSEYLGEFIDAYYKLYFEQNNITINSKGKENIKMFSDKLANDMERTNALTQCVMSIIEDHDINMIIKASNIASKKMGYVPQQFKNIV